MACLGEEPRGVPYLKPSSEASPTSLMVKHTSVLLHLVATVEYSLALDKTG